MSLIRFSGLVLSDGVSRRGAEAQSFEILIEMKTIVQIFPFTLLIVACSGEEPLPEEIISDVDSVKTADLVEMSDSSTIQCPFCGFEKMEELPTEVCLISYDCDSCKKTIHPEEGDCCVFCSYGDHECPSMEE